jgi:small subunit ribosomal protein S16
VVRIRLQRMGRTHRPFYRIQVTDGRRRRDGAAIEELGWYDPIAKDPAKQVSINEERIKYWLSVGAQPSDTMKDFLARQNLIETAEWEARRAAARARVEAAKAPPAEAPVAAAEAAPTGEAPAAAAEAVAAAEEPKAE